MSYFYVDVCGPEPCFLPAILTILGVKKSALLGAIFGQSGSLMLRKPYFLQGFFTILEVSLLHLKNAQKNTRS